MNYRHAFHAGNFADVVKHAVLVRILVHLRAKPAAFRVIDTHAGAGLYDLAGPEAAPQPRMARRHRAARRRLRSASRRVRCSRPISMPSPRLNDAGGLTRYPGSPALVRAFLRAQDRLIACELEPNAAVALARYLAGDRRSKALAIDGWTALQRLCAAQGAARPRADRSAIRGRGRFRAARHRRSRRAPQMGGRHLPDVVSDQGSRRAGRAGAAFAAQRHRARSCAPN